MPQRRIAVAVAAVAVIALALVLMVGERSRVVVRTREVSPVEVVGGVPVGVERSPAGALAAAERYVSVSAQTLEQDPSVFARLVGEVYAPAVRERVLEEAREIRSSDTLNMANYARGGRGLAVIAAQQLVSFSPAAASVRCWLEGIVWGPGSRRGRPGAWSTRRCPGARTLAGSRQPPRRGAGTGPGGRLRAGRERHLRRVCAARADGQPVTRSGRLNVRRMVLVAVVLSIGALLSAADAGAVVPPVGVQFGHAARVAKQAPRSKDAGGPCEVGVPVIGGLVSEITGRLCSAAGGAVGAVGDLAGEAAQAVGGGVLEELARWMIAAASQITTFVSKAMTDTTTPQLESSWFESQFEPMVDLGAGLGLLVALISLGSAAIRRSPELLAATLSGIARAGIGTGLVVALTVLGLSLADQISTAVLDKLPPGVLEGGRACLGHERFRGV